MKNRCLRIAVVGIGGFGRTHHQALRELEQEGGVRVVAACDSRLDELDGPLREHQFAARNVTLHHDMETMLEAHVGSLDMVDIVSPIRYHAEHHLACVNRGLPCYLEKPPTLDPDELSGMLAVETRATVATQVGFNHIGQSWRLAIKGRVVAGEFGPLRRVSFIGMWRRSLAYYERNNWAGRLMLDGRPLLDSCCGNAMAHHVHNLLFHAGTESLMAWADPRSVEAELYRANAIESTDTVFARGTLGGGIEFRLVASHACEEFLEHEEVLECEHARIRIPSQGPVRIEHSDGRCEYVQGGDTSGIFMLKANLSRYCDYIRGLLPRPDTRLADTRAFVTFNAQLFLSAGHVNQVGDPHVERSQMEGDTRESIRITGLRSVADGFIENGLFPSEKSVAWAATKGRSFSSHVDTRALREVLDAILSQVPSPGVA